MKARELNNLGILSNAMVRVTADDGAVVWINGVEMGRVNVSNGELSHRAEAGSDSGITDPVASDLPRVFAADRDSEGYKLAADMLLGRDPFGGEYVAAFRDGRLGAE